MLLNSLIFPCNLPQSPSDPGTPGTPGSAWNTEDVELSVLKMKSLLHKVMGGGTDKELIALLDKAVADSGQITQLVIAWVDLIDILVQHSETRYGTAKNNGFLKAAFVKRVIKELLAGEKSVIPGVPGFLVPVIIDTLVDWGIDAMVEVTNNYGLWETSDPKPNSLWASFHILFQKVRKYVVGGLEILSWPFVRIYELLRRNEPLPPGVESAIQAVRQRGLITNERQFFTDLIDGVIWIGNHKTQLIAAVQLVFETVQLAEKFFNASGEEKKQYATQIILAVLTDDGFVEKGSLAYSFLEAFIGISIDSAVFLFNKRGVFSHRGLSPSS